MILQGLFAGLDVCVEDTRRVIASVTGGAGMKLSLAEHKVEHTERAKKDPGRTECFLECENGREFKISIRLPHDWNGQNFDCTTYVDGRKLDGSCFYKDKKSFVQTKLTETTANGPINKALCFGEINLTEDLAAATVDAEGLQDVGIIRIDIVEGIIGKRTGVGKARLADQMTIHEGSKKGMIGSVVKGGTPSAWTAPNICQFTPTRKWEVEHRVVFKYRSRELLAAMRVIELPPPPPQLVTGKRKRPTEEEEENADVPNGSKEANESNKIMQVKVEKQAKIRALRAELNALTRGEDIKPGLKELILKGVGTNDAPIDLTDDD